MWSLFIAILIFGVWTFISNAKHSRRMRKILEQKQLVEQEKQIVVEFMHTMVEAVAEGSDRSELFQRIIHAATVCTGAYSACIYYLEADGFLRGVASEGLFPPQSDVKRSEFSQDRRLRSQQLESILRSESFAMGEGLVGQVAQSKRALLIANARLDPRVYQHEDPDFQMHSLILAPVLFQGDLLAVLAVANPADGVPFNATDFSLVENLADQAGLALHNCHSMQVQIEKNKLDTDIELASTIQGLLLPKKFPPSEHLEFAVEYAPAQKIGGDLYEIFAIDADRIGVAVADVSGKGVAASLLMAICQTHLHHYSKVESSPAKVLSRINRSMLPTMPRDMFITIIYAVFDRHSDQVVLARAGHELPLFYDSQADGSVVIGPVDSPGMSVGMVESSIFDSIIEDRSIQFGENDALMLYTDGLTEMANRNGEEFSTARLQKVLETHGSGSAQTLLQQALESVNRFSGTSDHLDDLTVVTIKHAQPAAVVSIEA